MRARLKGLEEIVRSKAAAALPRHQTLRMTALMGLKRGSTAMQLRSPQIPSQIVIAQTWNLPQLTSSKRATSPPQQSVSYSTSGSEH